VVKGICRWAFIGIEIAIGIAIDLFLSCQLAAQQLNSWRLRRHDPDPETR